MSLDIPARAHAPAALPIQYVEIQLTPIVGGQYALAMVATLLDEQELEFVAEDIANARVDTLDEALAVIRQNVAALAPSCAP